MRMVLLSDTHTKEHLLDLPDGDILIHAGDLDIRDRAEFDYMLRWFSKLNYDHIIFISGNHDIYMEQLYRDNIKPELPDNVHYLMNNMVTIDGIKIWGSPFSPQFGNWAFQGHLEELNKIWSTIPLDTDIVITHCNPFSINDQVRGLSQGCPALRDRIKEIKPRYHISGHIHEGHGIYCDENTIYINASIMDAFYEPVNKPIVFLYE